MNKNTLVKYCFGSCLLVFYFNGSFFAPGYLFGHEVENHITAENNSSRVDVKFKMIQRVLFTLVTASIASIIVLDLGSEATAFTSASCVITNNSNAKSISRVQRQQILQRIRGETYGSSNNSTIPTAQAAAIAVGVQPPEAQASVRKWKWAYMLQKYATPVLHLLDRQKPPNSSLNVYCMWWKALSGINVNSPVYDNGLSYDLLPRGTRRIIKWFYTFFPRLHHANVEIRTAFLDQAIIRCVVGEKMKNSNVRIRLITLGAGYDVRSIKLKERGIIDESIELDLPAVVDAKQRLLSSQRFQNRRPQTKQHMPKQYYRVDLNNITHVQIILNEILLQQEQVLSGEIWHNIFVLEAVLIYLNEGIPHSLLRICHQALVNHSGTGSLCFADRLENVPGGDYNSSVREMTSTGWNLVEWLPKPGLARHMGRAEMF
jgi:Leucine carboxyl methyltransferase